MNPKPLFYCKICRRSDLTKQSRHMHKGSTCTGDFVAVDPDSCIRCYYFTHPGCTSALKQNANPATKSTCFFPQPSSPSAPAAVIVKPAAKSLAPSLIDGHDKDAAKQLTKLFTDAQTGMRRIVALGLFAWELKESRLKHGQFGPWLAAHCPKLVRTDAATTKAKPSAALSSYMELTKGVLENVGFTIEKYLAHISNSHEMGICHGGKYLLLADKKLPKEVLPLKEKICDLIDGKTKKQLFSEFKQAEEDSTGKAKPKRGNLSGRGCTREDRANAAAIAEQEEITALNLESENLTMRLLELSGPKGIGRFNDSNLDEFWKAIQTAHNFTRDLVASRQGTRA